MLSALCIFGALAAAQSLTVVSRSEWGARPPVVDDPNVINVPTNYVTIHHGQSSGCQDKGSCMSMVQAYQNEDMDVKGYNDISYNFVVGEDGNVYEGRGWDKRSANAQPANAKVMVICVIGTFHASAPNSKALAAVQELIGQGVSAGKIAASYKLVGHRQVASTDCPGDAFYNIITGWPHWASPRSKQI